MKKHLLTILLALFSHSAIAQTSYDEPDLDFKALDKDVNVICLKDCRSQFKVNVVTLDSILKHPVGDARVVSDYGWRVHPILKRKSFHSGVDFAVPVGTPVQAGENGTVVYAGWMDGYGKLLVIKHDSTFSTVYGHLNRFGQGIKVGAHVKRGQVVAESGNTGRSTGPHLHYEIRMNGLAIHHRTGEALSNRVLAFDGQGNATTRHVSLSNSQIKPTRIGTRIQTRFSSKSQLAANKRIALEGLKDMRASQQKTGTVVKTSAKTSKVSQLPTKATTQKTSSTAKQAKAVKVSAKASSTKTTKPTKTSTAPAKTVAKVVPTKTTTKKVAPKATTTKTATTKKVNTQKTASTSTAKKKVK
ncbi:M23 family metallopeptidase [Pelistega ratti]|uniref:M23 family metallopeptidase n=1 Tax=Pelistega ratti TaxID=2652177 RepID=UPI00135B11B8|nr:M23 family metallopeptidase [Pelistega ratti]